MRLMLPLSILMVLLSLASNSPASAQTTLQCGDIIEGEFTEDEQPFIFDIELSAGDSIEVKGEPLGGTLQFLIALTAPNEHVVARSDFDPESEPMFASDILSANGTYQIIAYNAQFTGTNEPVFWSYYPGGIGVYTLFIGCTLRDGTVIEPGDTIPEPAQGGNGSVPFQPSFSGFGFPGVASRDFSEGIELPLTLGQPQTAPVASDVALYTYNASAEEVVTLNISRASGDLSIGVTVINKATNEIIFLGGLPSSDNLSVELTFPTDDTYAIGLFRLDTAEHSGTSGAVQISLE